MKRIAAVLTASMALAASASAQERPKSFVDVATVVPGLIVEMHYRRL
jgi:D-alanyl-D-alanine dipeptidase